MLKRILVVMVVILVLSALFAMTVAAQGAGDPAAGKTAWAQRPCKSCHGDNGEGKYAGPLAGTTRTSAEWITQVHTPRANMPAYTTAQISDTVITDMWAYMKTLTKPASFTPVSTTVPAGALPGHQLFVDKRCVACHGNVQAFVKSRFVDQNREVTTDVVLKQLRTPARNMPMFSATQVTDPQAAQIADYLKAQATIVKAAAVVTSTAPVTATKPVTATAAVTATKATTVTAPAAAAPAPVALPKTGANLSASAQATTTKPVTATAPVTATKPVTVTAPVTATKPVTATAPVTATKPATTTAPVTTAKPVTTTAPAVMPKTGAELSVSTQATTTKPVTATVPVTATKPVTATAPVTATKPATTTAVVTATKPATTTAVAAAAAPAPAPAALPKTGGEMGLLVLSGLSLLGISAGLAIRGRRR